MKLNEYGNKCFAVGEKVRVNGIDYRFKAIVPNSGEVEVLFLKEL